MKTGVFSTFVFVSLLFFLNPVFAGYFERPEASPVLMHLAGSLKITGEPARPGDEVGIFDERGNIVGLFVVVKDGIFGDVPVSGDYEPTHEAEGAEEGEILKVKIWQASTDTEYSAGSIIISLPEKGEAVYTPYPDLPLRFEGGSFYLLDIEVVK